MGWEVCPTLLHMSNSAPFPALPPWVNHGWLFTLPPSIRQSWLLDCHHQSDTADLYLATISQSRLTVTLPPSVKHGWLLRCHHQLDTADICLATMSRTPCPVVANVLDIQHLQMKFAQTTKDFITSKEWPEPKLACEIFREVLTSSCGAFMCSAIFCKKWVLSLNFWTEAHRIMILVSKAMCSGLRNQMAPFM